MSRFKKASRPTHAKIGGMGLAGSGKTYTSGVIARGLHKMLVEKNLRKPTDPVFFVETERGSEFEEPRFRREGIDLQVDKTKALSDLISNMEEVAKIGNAICLIDSITAFWKEFCEAYAKKKKRTRLQFQDWSYLKGSSGWGRFTDLFVNIPVHCVMLGRAGFEYDLSINEDTGDKELSKGDVKMKAEGETAYEPDLLFLMERFQESDGFDNNGKPILKVYHQATILKDRSHDLDGQRIRDPEFKHFLPYFERIDFGGQHVAVDLTRNSEGMIQDDRRTTTKRDLQMRDVALEEVKALLIKHFPSASSKDKESKAAMLETHFGTRAWAKVQTFTRDQVENGRNTLWQALEGVPYTFGPAPAPGDLAQQGAAKAANETAGAAVDELLGSDPQLSEQEQTRNDAAEQSEELFRAILTRIQECRDFNAVAIELEGIRSLGERADITTAQLKVLQEACEIKAAEFVKPEPQPPQQPPEQPKEKAASAPEKVQQALAADIEKLIMEATDVKSLKDPRDKIALAEKDKFISNDELRRLKGLANEREASFKSKQSDLF